MSHNACQKYTDHEQFFQHFRDYWLRGGGKGMEAAPHNICPCIVTRKEWVDCLKSIAADNNVDFDSSPQLVAVARAVMDNRPVDNIMRQTCLPQDMDEMRLIQA